MLDMLEYQVSVEFIKVIDQHNQNKGDGAASVKSMLTEQDRLVSLNQVILKLFEFA